MDGNELAHGVQQNRGQQGDERARDHEVEEWSRLTAGSFWVEAIPKTGRNWSP